MHSPLLTSLLSPLHISPDLVILPTVPLLPLLALTDLLTTGGTRHNVRVEEVMEVAKELKVVVGEVSRKRRVEEFESELTE